MSSTSTFLAAVLLLASVATGCTSASEGEPRPEGTATETSDAPDPEKLPARPRESKVEGINPCSLIPQSEWSDYHMRGPGRLEHDEKFDSASLCNWDDTDTDLGYLSITLITTEGIEGWLDGSKRVRAEEAEPIFEYAALTVVNPGKKNTCFVAVDVAEGNQLLAQARLDSDLDDVPPVCEYAHQFATSAMRTVVEV